MSALLRRLALLVEYDGTSYAGSQLQANGPSIQAELERAIMELTGAFARVAFAGRTDAGVHAAGQIACFDTHSVYSCEAFVGGINIRLPETIAVHAARDVDLDFDPRRRAISRCYRYSIVNCTTKTPLRRGSAWRVAAHLNVEEMRLAAGLLLGEQDFAAFAAAEASGSSTKRCIQRLCVRQSGAEVSVEITANAFLMHQVRRTVAALVDIGSGRLPIDEFERHLRDARPGSYGRSAPAHGLCLMSVIYATPLFETKRE